MTTQEIKIHPNIDENNTPKLYIPAIQCLCIRHLASLQYDNSQRLIIYSDRNGGTPRT